MINRDAQKEVIKLSKQFKAVAIVGPRQSGKTTLARHVFNHLPYVSLENPDTRNFALDDPRGFLAQYSSGAILDEAQRAPQLFSYLQQILDESSETGRFIITGSNNFLLQESISQSLAGRIAYIYLLPFSLSELKKDSDLAGTLFKGLYPPIYDQPVEARKWYTDYIRTYIERDVRQIKNITDLIAFERFLRLCAGRIGQLLNMSSLAIETGVDSKTIASWIGVLESSFITFRLHPHHVNFNKRVVKMAKLYFYDTGVACALLGIENVRQLNTHYSRGSIFENLIVTEFIKQRFNRGFSHNLFFWRDNVGHEVDIIAETPAGLVPVEIKAGQTITGDFFKNLQYWMKISNNESGIIIYAGNQAQERSTGIRVVPWYLVSDAYSTVFGG